MIVRYMVFKSVVQLEMQNFMKWQILFCFSFALGDKCQESVAGKLAVSKPIRVHFEYNFGPEYDSLRDVILPKVLSFLQNSVSVRPYESVLRFSYQCTMERQGYCIDAKQPKCGDHVVSSSLLSGVRLGSTVFPEGPGVNADLVVFVSVGSDMGDVKAEAGSCLSRDVCGRPLAGSMKISRGLILAANKSDLLMDTSVTTLLHEFFHILGFSRNSFPFFRDSKTLALRDQPTKPIFYKCRKNADNKYTVQWDVEATSGTHSFHFMPGVVRPLSVRGLLAEECKCPTDPLKKYTSANIEDCLHHSNKCALAVVTPKVAAAAQSYFDCPSAAGMELENAFGISCEGMRQSHWKHRMISGEFMLATTIDRPQFISPMSFALLEDSGWYVMNYDMLSGLVGEVQPAKGMWWGYHEGCPFLQGKCISDNKVVGGDFCLPSQADTFKCSVDRRDILVCTTGHTRGSIEFKTQLAPYMYGSEYFHGQKLMDYCPAFEQFTGSACDTDSRCMHISGNERPECLTVVCNAESYQVVVRGIIASEPCTKENQTVYVVENRTKKTITCANPEIICAILKVPHMKNFDNLSNILPNNALVTPCDDPANLDTKNAYIFVPVFILATIML